MITTNRTETFFNVEMTAEQAFYLHIFVSHISPSDLDAVCTAAKLAPGSKEHTEISDAVNAFGDALSNRRPT